MSLQFTRAKLSMRMMMVDLHTCSQRDVENIIQDIDDWYSELKKWESGDSFALAFKQHRMTARVVARVATSTKNTTTNKLSMNRYDLTTHKVGHTKQTTTDIYDTGLSGMKLRTNPNNFGQEQVIPGGMKKIDGQIKKVPTIVTGKYNLGLHDLSACLLSTQRGSILNQLAWKEGAKEPEKNAIAFMPLPLEADLQLFYVLNAKAKDKECKAKHPALYEKVVWVRRRMTRVKLANEVDAGSGFVNIGTGWKDTQRRYKYGLGLVAIPEKTGAVGIGEAERRTRLALHYRHMLQMMPAMPKDNNSPGTNNEMVIAYRQHASNCFPLFAVFEKEGNRFEVIDGPEGFHADWIGTTVPRYIDN